MQEIIWEKDALEIINHIPFWVRSKVKKKIEQWAQGKGINTITAQVLTEAKRELKDNAATVEKGYSVEACFGRFGCKHAVTSSEELLKKLETLLEEEKITSFLKKKTGAHSNITTSSE